jgi:mannosyltransferase OCH1-like enzyme
MEIIPILILLLLIVYTLYYFSCRNEYFEIPVENIPLIIHQTWKTKDLDNIDKKFLKGINSWKQLNPEFEHRLYDDADCLNFIKSEYPMYLDFYESLELPVQKADIFRYLIINKYGGIYADIDTLCLKNIKETLDAPMIVGIEYLPEINKGKIQYNQWFFGSVPNNPIFIKTIDEIVNRKKKLDFWGPTIMLSLDNRIVSDTEVTLWLTGPYVFSDFVSKVSKDSIHIYDSCVFGSYDSRPSCRNKGYLIHGFDGTWKGRDKWPESRVIQFT